MSNKGINQSKNILLYDSEIARARAVANLLTNKLNFHSVKIFTNLDGLAKLNSEAFVQFPGYELLVSLDWVKQLMDGDNPETYHQGKFKIFDTYGRVFDENRDSETASYSNDQIQASYINADNRVAIREMDMEVNFLADTLKSEDRQKYFKNEEFPGEIVVTTEKYAEENPETVQAFVNAISKATDWINANESKKVAETLMPYYDGTSIETLTERVDVIKPAITKTGRITEEGQQAVIDFNIETGTITKSIPYEELIDMSFVEEYQNNK